MLTYGRVRSLFDYDPDTGRLVWKRPRGRMRSGEEAGCNSGRGYIVLRIDGRMHYAHRVAFLWAHGYLPEEVDHINGDRSDNRRSNLRASTRPENSKNASRAANNTSGVPGVLWREHARKWTARIKVNQKNYYLGCFEQKADAIAARKSAEARFGFHTGHGKEATPKLPTSPKKQGRSGVKGVTRNDGGWAAIVYHKGKRHYAGNFKTIEDAAKAHAAKTRELNGLAS